MANGRSFGRAQGSGRGGVGDKKDWECHSGPCGCRSTKGPWTNHAWRDVCLKCRVPKGQCGAINLKPEVPSRSAKNDGKLAQATKEAEKFKMLFKKEQAKNKEAVSTEEEEEDPADAEKTKVSEELKVCRRKLARYRAFPADEADDSEKQCIIDLEAKIQGLQGKVRDSQPFNQRLAGIQRQLAKVKDSLKKEQHTVVMQEKSLEEVQKKRDTAAGLVLTHEASIAQLEADLRDVHAKEAGDAVAKEESLDDDELDSMFQDPQWRENTRKDWVRTMGPKGDEAFDRKFPQRPKGAASNPPVGEVVALKQPEIVKMDIDFDSIFEAGVRSGLIPPDSDKEAAKDKYNEDAKRRKTEGVAK